jgi:spermidine synthase
VVGDHLIVDAFGCDSEILNDADLLEQKLTELLQELGMQILHTYFHRFHPQGVTGTIVISTSHIAIHTWPEQNYAAFDLFTCGDMASAEQIENLLKQLSAERCVVYQLTRGKLTGQLPAIREVNLHAQIKKTPSLHEGVHEYVADRAGPKEPLTRQNGILYHEALVHPVLSMSHSRDRVLIIGACDDQPLWEILKYQDVSRVHLVDIGPAMPQEALAEGAFLDPRVKVFQHGSQFFLTRRRRKYDVIIINLPDPADEEIARLYTREFFKRLSVYLAPDGMMVCQAHSPQDAPLVFWSIAETLESAGLQTLSYHVRVSDNSDRGFHLAGTSKPIKRKIIVPEHDRTLLQDLGSCFEFDEHILIQRNHAVINTLDELNLHTLYQKAVGKKN